MSVVKAAVRRIVSGLTGQAEGRAAIDKIATRLEVAAASSREAGQRLKTVTETTRDRVVALQRQAAEDRQGLLDIIARLEEEQKATRAQLAAMSRLLQRTFVALVDTEPLDESALDRVALVAHIRRAVAAAPMRTDPFPHLVIPDLLPADFYGQLLRAIPAPTFWRDAGYRRENWMIEEDRASRLSETTWRFMHRQIAGKELIPLLLDRFADAIADYWRDTFGLDPSLLDGHYASDEGRLMLRRPGYELQPHLDPPNAILTFLLYLAQPGDSDTYGTDLYASDPLPANRVGILYPAKHGIRIERTTTVPYRANTALAFITPRSVHGAELPDTVDQRFERVSYQYLAFLDDHARRIVQKHRKVAAGAAADY